MEIGRPFKARTVLVSLAAALFALTLVRCGSSPSGPASGTFGHIYTSLIQTSCVDCHKPGGAGTVAHNSTIDFSTQEKAYTTLLAAVAVSSPPSCNSAKLIVSGSPSTSYFAGVLFSEYGGASDFGNHTGCVPYNAHWLDQHPSDAEKTSIVTWITNGAQNN